MSKLRRAKGIDTGKLMQQLQDIGVIVRVLDVHQTPTGNAELKIEASYYDVIDTVEIVRIEEGDTPS